MAPPLPPPGVPDLGGLAPEPVARLLTKRLLRIVHDTPIVHEEMVKRGFVDNLQFDSLELVEVLKRYEETFFGRSGSNLAFIFFQVR